MKKQTQSVRLWREILNTRDEIANTEQEQFAEQSQSGDQSNWHKRLK
jgi:hypothetical protein